MSFKVLVIPEDPTYNGYLLKPLVERILREVGKPHAQVLVLRDPKTGSFENAYDLIKNGSLCSRYGYYDLWLFLPDGDKHKDLTKLEESASDQKVTLIAAYLNPEVEATIIAGHPSADVRGWDRMRAHPQFKEKVFQPFLEAHGNPTSPGQGREKLMKEALQNYDRLKKLMPELAALEKRVEMELI